MYEKTTDKDFRNDVINTVITIPYLLVQKYCADKAKPDESMKIHVKNKTNMRLIKSSF